VIALLGLLGGGVVSVVGWIQVANLKNAANPTQTNTITVWIEAVTYTLLALFSLFGLVGAIIKKRGLVQAFSVLLGTMLIISVVAGSVSLYYIFHQGAQKAADQCQNAVDTDSDAVGTACKAAVRVADIVVVVIYVITWLVELWGAVIVSSYATELGEEDRQQNTEQRIHRLESNEYNQQYRNDLKMQSHYSP